MTKEAVNKVIDRYLLILKDEERIKNLPNAIKRLLVAPFYLIAVKVDPALMIIHFEPFLKTVQSRINDEAFSDENQVKQPDYKPEDFRPSIIFTHTFAAGDGLYKVTVEKVS